VSNGLLDPEGKFNVLRFDRPTISGGGVCAFINKCYAVKKVDIVNDVIDDGVVENYRFRYLWQ
jgi:hypothetical protein